MNKCSEYERIFNHFDEDGDGKISPRELQRCVGSTGTELLEEDLQLVIDLMDSDGDGLLGLDDFFNLMKNEDEEKKIKELKEAFGMYEMDGCECITPTSLKRMLSRLGEDWSVDECAFMINQFDLNGDGVLNFDEFKVMMST